MPTFLPTLAVLLGASSLLPAEPPDPFADLRRAQGNLEEEIRRADPNRFSRSYAFRTLHAATNEEILAWVGAGRNLSELKAALSAPIIPQDLGQPETAVRHLVESVRDPEVAQKFPLQVPKLPEVFPSSGSMAFSGWLVLGSESTLQTWCLYWDTERAWLATTFSSSPYMRQKPTFSSPPEYRLSWDELSPADARQIAKVVWLLKDCSIKRPTDRAPAPPRSTADSINRMIFRSLDPDRSFAMQGWRGSLGRQGFPSLAEWNDEVAFQFVASFVSSAARAHARDEWSANDEEKEPAMQQALARNLELLTSLQPDVALAALEVVGERGLVEVTTALRAIEKSLPPPSDNELRLEELQRKIDEEVSKRGGQAGYVGYAMRRESSPGIALPVKNDRELAEVDAWHREAEELREKRPPGTSHYPALRAALASAQKQITAWHDSATLRAWVLAGTPHPLWAYRRLMVLDPPSAIQVLETLASGGGGQEYLRIEAAYELFRVAPNRALKLAGALTEEERRSPLGFVLNPKTTWPGKETPRTLANLLRILEGSAPGDRGHAIDDLVPSANPNKFPEAAVDQALTRMLSMEGFDNSSLKASAAQALARRNPIRHWEVLEKIAAASSDDHLLYLLTPAVGQERAQFAPRLSALLKPRLQGFRLPSDDLLWLIWAADLRDLKPEIEALATAKPSDYEGESGAFVRFRQHTARIVASLWNEEDPATRARMIAALGVARPFLLDPPDDFGSAGHRHSAETFLAAALKQLSPEERTQFAKFVDWLEARPKLTKRAISTYGANAIDSSKDWLAAVRKQLQKAGP